MSSAREIHLSVEEQRTPDSICREVILRANSGPATVRVRYEIYDTSIGDLAVLDGLVQGVLLHCMRRGLPLRIHGSLSSSAVHNLQEFQRAWSMWKPQVYRHIDLIPDAVVAERPRSDRTIQAFSGGVDATFTLISNKFLNKERGGYDISAALLVHGFDIGYNDAEGFAKHADRVRETLGHVGVELKIVRTNSMLLRLQDWLDSVPLQLTACLHQFSNHYGTALVSSAEPYDALCLPLGSNPITDHLLSGDLQTIVHYGAGCSRTQKVEAIAAFPFFADRLQVCWEGGSAHENCGRCEKCLRTRLNFAAVGNNEPGCFRGAFEAKMLRKLRAKSPIQIAELRGIVTYVRRRRLSYPWINPLCRRIMLAALAIPIRRATRWPALKVWLRSAFRPLRRRQRSAYS
jgi:hypothetical protein